MALPGPAPKENKIGRTPAAEWTEVPDVTFEAGRKRNLPNREGGWTDPTLKWWDVIRVLPHASLWDDSDWIVAEDTAVFKDRFYRGTASASDAVEMRRREDTLGFTREARRKLRIRYVPVRVEPADDATPEGTVTPIHGRRRSLPDDD